MTGIASPHSPAIERSAVVASRFAAAGAVLVALIIVALHVIKPEIEPSWRFISEYATGRHGWITQRASTP